MVPRVLVLSLAGLLAVLCQAQDDTAPADFQAPVIRTGTQLVEVDVIVRDRNGPVADLTAGDFTVRDNGKTQQITSFSVNRGFTVQRVEDLPDGVIANRLNPYGQEPVGPTVILWDLLNTELADQAWVRQQVMDYLGTLQSGDQVALYSLLKSLRVLHDFTGHPELLMQALSYQGPQQSVNLSTPDLTNLAGQATLSADDLLASGDPAAQEEAQALAEALQEMSNFQKSAALEVEWYNIRDRALITLGALREIAKHLDGIPGRKKLIWISGSFPALSMQENSRVGATQIESLNIGFQIQKAVEELNAADVAVYPIDARGLTTGAPSASSTVDLTAPPGVNPGGLLNAGIDTMNLLASGTGGRAFYGNNDVAGSVRQVFQDFEVTYTLGFNPTDKSMDGSYHKLEVKVGRRGVEVRHRRGYYASDALVATPTDRVSQRNQVMKNLLNATGVGLVGEVVPVEAQPGIYQLTLVIDARDLYFEYRDGEWLALIEFATRFGDSFPPRGTVEEIRINLSEERYQEALEEGLYVTRPLVVGDQVGDLRIAIQDRTTGVAGSIRVPLGQATQPNLAQDAGQTAAPAAAAGPKPPPPPPPVGVLVLDNAESVP